MNQFLCFFCILLSAFFDFSEILLRLFSDLREEAYPIEQFVQVLRLMSILQRSNRIGKMLPCLVLLVVRSEAMFTEKSAGVCADTERLCLVSLAGITDVGIAQHITTHSCFTLSFYTLGLNSAVGIDLRL